ncbi:hypothetical protein GCM10011609_21870 [Lentzea pudingi]|uniref:DUF3558 domain-containing protein n=1 Tax=Lentzea pudingi TaxID=1789439 RepID=A0ABQ2HNC5_9PSEU|nr:hypothetical protein [Lentzea pudingi]GGM85249.1 hypothetical protein GCM10011609_21870 [Lentzea pudingi]
MNRPLLVGGIAAGLLVFGGVVAALTVSHVHDTNGGSGEQPAVCGNVSAAALARARTPTPNTSGSYETKLLNGVRTNCSWIRTEGPGLRNTDVSVLPGREADFDEFVRGHLSNAPDLPRQRPLEGLGDEAAVLQAERGSSGEHFTEISVVVRKDNRLVVVRHIAREPGGKPDVAELEAAAKGIAEEFVGKL